MKEEKEDMILRELFRNKLEQAEVFPSASVRSNLMRRLAWKEFLHFIPSKFNIYYLAGILIATVAAVLIVTSDNGKSNQVPAAPQEQGKIESPVQPEKPAVNSVTSKPSREAKITAPVTATIEELQDPTVQILTEDSIKREDNQISRSDLKTTISARDLFTPVNNNKLQSRNLSANMFIVPSVTEGCAPLKVQFAGMPGIDSCYWSFGDGGSSSEKSPERIYNHEGEYKVVLKVFRSGGLTETWSTLITVHPNPVARFEIFPENAIIPEDEIRLLNFSAQAVSYKWEFGDGSTSELFEPVHRYDKFGAYNISLVATSEYGCSDSVVNAFSGSSYFIDFPNAFIPNPDGPAGGYYSSKSDESAQIFHPSFSGVSDYRLTIFNKAGMLLFETHDINVGWDGYYKGQLCSRGVYIWKVRGYFSNGETFNKMGDVTLLQN